jgi:hypothetical protein
MGLSERGVIFCVSDKEEEVVGWFIIKLICVTVSGGVGKRLVVVWLSLCDADLSD